MAVDPTYQEYIQDLFAQAGHPVRARPMFGGAGVYYRNKIIGVIVGNELYLRVDVPPTPIPRTKRFGLKYVLVPPDVLEDQELLATWIQDVR